MSDQTTYEPGSKEAADIRQWAITIAFRSDVSVEESIENARVIVKFVETGK